MDLTKYPRVKKFLEQHPEMTMDQALFFTENLLRKLEGEGNNVKTN